MLLSFKNKKSLILLSILIIICLIFIDNMLFKQPVIAYQAKVNNYSKGVTVTGTITSFNQPFLSSPITALVEKVYVKEGDYVNEDQALAILENNEAIANLEAAKSNLEEAKAILKDFKTGSRKQDIAIEKEKVNEIQLKINTEKQNFQRNNLEYQNQASRVARLEKLYQAGAVSFREYERASFVLLKNQEAIDISKGKIEELKSQIVQTKQLIDKLEEGFKEEQVLSKRALVNARKAELKSALSNLEDYTIKAPQSGYISDVLLKKGALSSPDSPIFKFIADKNLYFKALVEENNIESVFWGQEALIVLDAYSSRIFNGVVFNILKEVDPQSGTFIVKVSLPKKYIEEFFAGMTGDITFVTKPKGSIILPSSFVFDNDEKKYVFIKKNGRAIKKYVIANYFTNFAIIKKGLAKNDIVLKPLKKETLENNKRIKIKKYEDLKR